MMTTLITANETDADHLAEVAAEMDALGSPEIRIVDCGDWWCAIEGSHRIAAAFASGIVPTWVELEQDDRVEVDSLDLDGRDWRSLDEYDAETDTVPAWAVAELVQESAVYNRSTTWVLRDGEWVLS